jgi:protein-S-isoprenylcysteine O-methyltransferase Ste14
MSLAWKLTLRIVVGISVLFAVLFLSAGTLRYWQGWAFLGVWLIPTLVFVVYFCRRDRELVRRRLLAKEKIGAQKWIMRAAFLLFVAGFLIPGLDFRFAWSKQWLGAAVPLWLEMLSLAIVLGAYLGLIWVMDVNRYAARTIQVEAGQTVIATGPYKWVRHPFYSGSLLMFLAVPLALGSYVAVPAFALMIPVYVLRLLNEEKMLRAELPGYSEYCAATPYRLVPHLW